MRTAAAVSPIAAPQVAVSFAAFIVVYGLLGGVAFYLIAKHARRGPEPATAAAVGGGGLRDAGNLLVFLWGILWAVYFMLDGFDLGSGVLLPFLAKSDTERKLVYRAMGPFWDGN